MLHFDVFLLSLSHDIRNLSFDSVNVRANQENLCHTGPGSLPGYPRRGPGGGYDDGASDISSTSGFSAFGYRSGATYYLLNFTIQMKISHTIIM